MIALLGGNIDMFYSNPGEALAQMDAKKVRILGVASAKRLEGAPNIPTLKELGYNVSMQQLRLIAASKDISKEAVQYHEELYRKLANSAIWKEKYIKENMLTREYATSAETQKIWDNNNEFCARIMKEMGVIK